MSSRYIGIRLADGTYFPIFEESGASRKRLTLAAAREGQKSVVVDLYLGEGESFASARKLGSLSVETDQDSLGEIELIVGVDTEGHLDARAGMKGQADSQSFAISLRDVELDQSPDWDSGTNFPPVSSPDDSTETLSDPGENGEPVEIPVSVNLGDDEWQELPDDEEEGRSDLEILADENLVSDDELDSLDEFTLEDLDSDTPLEIDSEASPDSLDVEEESEDILETALPGTEDDELQNLNWESDDDLELDSESEDSEYSLDDDLNDVLKMEEEDKSDSPFPDMSSSLELDDDFSLEQEDDESSSGLEDSSESFAQEEEDDFDLSSLESEDSEEFNLDDVLKEDEVTETDSLAFATDDLVEPSEDETTQDDASSLDGDLSLDDELSSEEDFSLGEDLSLDEGPSLDDDLGSLSLDDDFSLDEELPQLGDDVDFGSQGTDDGDFPDFSDSLDLDSGDLDSGDLGAGAESTEDPRSSSQESFQEPVGAPIAKAKKEKKTKEKKPKKTKTSFITEKESFPRLPMVVSILALFVLVLAMISLIFFNIILSPPVPALSQWQAAPRSLTQGREVPAARTELQGDVQISSSLDSVWQPLETAGTLVYTSLPGDQWQDLSRLFYGTEAHGNELARSLGQDPQAPVPTGLAMEPYSL